ncbi:hypothetical protein L6164_025262 [Bauhinia variegata]|uniref:Uncharacterized protein n=1 Tax=Bauhinia variegata TaxID=167791 RepID=A0ACB9M348_BAUVA|nr:hypothetical protein L6164_025262 [Bauhinia variegata]
MMEPLIYYCHRTLGLQLNRHSHNAYIHICLGKVYILLLDTNNVATIIDPKILEHFMGKNVEYCMEDQPIPLI